MPLPSQIPRSAASAAEMIRAQLFGPEDVPSEKRSLTRRLADGVTNRVLRARASISNLIGIDTSAEPQLTVVPDRHCDCSPACKSSNLFFSRNECRTPSSSSCRTSYHGHELDPAAASSPLMEKDASVTEKECVSPTKSLEAKDRAETASVSSTIRSFLSSSVRKKSKRRSLGTLGLSESTVHHSSPIPVPIPAVEVTIPTPDLGPFEDLESLSFGQSNVKHVEFMIGSPPKFTLPGPLAVSGSSDQYIHASGSIIIVTEQVSLSFAESPTFQNCVDGMISPMPGTNLPLDDPFSLDFGLRCANDVVEEKHEEVATTVEVQFGEEQKKESSGSGMQLTSSGLILQDENGSSGQPAANGEAKDQTAADHKSVTGSKNYIIDSLKENKTFLGLETAHAKREPDKMPSFEDRSKHLPTVNAQEVDRFRAVGSPINPSVQRKNGVDSVQPGESPEGFRERQRTMNGESDAIIDRKSPLPRRAGPEAAHRTPQVPLKISLKAHSTSKRKTSLKRYRNAKMNGRRSVSPSLAAPSSPGAGAVRDLTMPSATGRCASPENPSIALPGHDRSCLPSQRSPSVVSDFDRLSKDNQRPDSPTATNIYSTVFFRGQDSDDDSETDCKENLGSRSRSQSPSPLIGYGRPVPDIGLPAYSRAAWNGSPFKLHSDDRVLQSNHE